MAPRGQIRSLELWDYAFFVYLALILTLLLFTGRNLGSIRHITIHLSYAAIGIILLCLNAYQSGRLVFFCRTWYVPFLYVFLFEELGRMIHIIQPSFSDPWVLNIESRVFGGYPTVWLQALANPWFTDLMSLFYVSYYFLIPALGLTLYLHHEWDRLSDFILTNTVTFFFCFLHYLLMPVAGPIFVPQTLPFELVPLNGGPATVFEQWLFFKGAIQGGAFPSSHVAVAVVVLFFALRYGKYPRILGVTVTGLALSTVYNGYHYGIDVIYGIAVGLVFCLVCPRLNRAWKRQ